MFKTFVDAMNGPCKILNMRGLKDKIPGNRCNLMDTYSIKEVNGPSNRLNMPSLKDTIPDNRYNLMDTQSIEEVNI